ncbi:MULTISPECIES: phosphate ABC transporter permease subunit PstC [Kocuria]|jgi:phosphate transport system permease protein|uniref:Phosphate transport system permease protein n=1 Tax=Kocuria rosea subsp. polaris TaxID=136273 RepID=A0A0A6VTZ9_KOCRO|nr:MULTISPECIES: phosphate ABC transporter permease subunit PstC [Kocuria]MCC5782057.1 phosphate ABC transporter permease subunit PstC [Kocuria sp. CCUG 69068]EYT55347.1 phosphate ABC transporter permease [Kocuria sp. UCD-OTCP]KHD97723.1 phosphate ABC transporter permease [Kocuria polaris]MCM3485922.1 phosphate ABC transporter permease subunit PstC [Kocuria rosea]MEB2528120.1 phosphate ABC transporter permease subunit PstC [Kocuria rosea]
MSTTVTTRKTAAGGKAGDSIFSGLSLGAGVLILAVLAAVALFLFLQALPTFQAPAEEISGGAGFWSYIWPMVIGTVIAAVIALVIATPIGVLVALYISHYAPARIAKPVGYVIDLLAAIPSVIYGAWGTTVLASSVVPFYDWLSTNLGFVPIFGGPASQTGKTMLTAGIVLAIMILPIITAMSRELFVQTPKLHEEAALALGATRWEMIRMTVLPFARPGIISAVMLALGRALGETMAVALVLSSGPLTASLVQSGNQTIAAEIALNFPEAYGLRLSELIAAGLILFVITLVVNMIARAIVARYKEFSGAN